MKHLFLTGERGVGKSTVIDRVLEAFPGQPGGFRTWFGPDRHEAEHDLYLSDVFKYLALAAVHYENGYRDVDLSCFNTYGRSLLEGSGRADLIIMDELGRLEGQAAEFQASVFRVLDGATPVLGVLRQDATGWIDDVRNHPNTEVIAVTEENRDDLPRRILERLKG